MKSKKFQFSANQPYHPLSTINWSLGTATPTLWRPTSRVLRQELEPSTHNFRVGVWLICLVLIFSFFVFHFIPSVQAAECQLINVITDKTQVGTGDRIQINITARKECIGKVATIKICDQTECTNVTSQIFDSRKVGGQDAINPIVIHIVPTDFFNQTTTAWVQATVPLANTIKSRPIAVTIAVTTGEKAKFGEFCMEKSQCSEGLFCAGNACVECTNSVLSECGTNQTCRDGACVAGDENFGNEIIKEKSTINSGSKKDGVLSNFPGEDLEANDVIKIVVGLSCWLTRVAFTLTFIFVIIAGFKFMAAQGNPAKYGEAVKNFQMVLWGILVIYGVYVIIATVANAVGIENFSFIPLVC